VARAVSRASLMVPSHCLGGQSGGGPPRDPAEDRPDPTAPRLQTPDGPGVGEPPGLLPRDVGWRIRGVSNQSTSPEGVLTTADASWNEAWNGTEQRRKFRFEGDRLIIEPVPAPSLLFPGKVDYRRTVWEREDSNTA
jgi:hypothetical protein